MVTIPSNAALPALTTVVAVALGAGAALEETDVSVKLPTGETAGLVMAGTYAPDDIAGGAPDLGPGVFAGGGGMVADAVVVMFLTLIA